MNPSMGLKHISLQSISNPKRDIIIFPFHLFRCLNGKREKAKTLWERERFHPMEMDSPIHPIPILSVDMDLMAFLDQPGT
jgi:hypothetical protein